MTPVGPAGARASAASAAQRASDAQRNAPGRRRKLPGSPRGSVPRRVSGPLEAPPLGPRPAPSPRPAPVPRRAQARDQTISARLAAFLPSLPDHPLLDRVVRGRAWIPLLGVMLVGIVAMQVELLKLTAATGRSIELISSLQGRNDVLRAQVTAASDPNRIERLASNMGMTTPGPDAVTFVRAGSASVRRALARIEVPNLAVFEEALRVSNAAPAVLAPTPPTTTPAHAASNTTPTAPGPQTTGTTTTTTTTSAAPAPSNASTGAQTTTPSAPPAIVP